ERCKPSSTRLARTSIRFENSRSCSSGRGKRILMPRHVRSISQFQTHFDRDLALRQVDVREHRVRLYKYPLLEPQNALQARLSLLPLKQLLAKHVGPHRIE